MALTPGTRLGVYEVTAQIGVGGMGEVYRARDSKLQRDVAIKVLPEAFAQDADRLARFEREARTLASLNHPHIAAIYGLEEATLSGPAASPEVGRREAGHYRQHALVMELVEGPTLADRIAQGPVPIDEALPIARQIAEALEAAHEQGIIHRDLKPANIKVRPDGTVKVLDFGLAKLTSPAEAGHYRDVGQDFSPAGGLTHSPTLTSPAVMTGMGVILGTAAYMSPEQARGRAVDKRTDIWAFGAVLYEMLTGARAFDGEDITEMIAAVVKTTPDWTALPAEVPPHIVTLIQRCLEKDRKARIGDIAVARFLLADHATLGHASGISAGSPVVGDARPRTRALVAAAVSVSVGAVVAGLAVWTVSRPVAPASQRVSVVLPANRPVAFGWSPGASLAISPDATQVAYAGTNVDAPPGPARISLHVRALGSLAVRDLPGTADAHQPFFSPDGQWVAFFTVTGELKKIALAGGNPVTLLEKINGSTWSFGAWTDDNTIVFSSSGEGLRRVSADGGSPETLTILDAAQGESRHPGPELVAGTQAVLFTVGFVQLRDPRVDAVMLDTRERHVVVENASYARYLSSGHLLFQRDEVILVAPFDPKRLAVTGPAVPLIDEVRRDGGVLFGGHAELVVSRTGTLAYAPAVDTTSVLGRVSRTGVFEPLGVPANRFDMMAVSPNGQYVAFDVLRGQETEVHVYDLARGGTTRLTQAGSDGGPSWHPNSRALAVTSKKPDVGGSGIFLKELGGTERLLVSKEGATSLRNLSWSPDGALLAYTAQTGSQHDIWVVTTGDKPVAHPLLNSPASEHSPRFSPDGRWLAYVSDESGRDEVYVRRYQQGDRFPVSTGGAGGPVWGRDGKELFFQGSYDGVQKLMAVSVSADGDTLLIGKPAPLLDLRVTGPTGVIEQYGGSLNAGQRWDIFPDGQHFLMSRGADPQGAREIVLVQHWFEELKRLVPAK